MAKRSVGAARALLQGFVSAFDIGLRAEPVELLLRRSRFSSEDDARALASDWEKVGGDLKTATERIMKASAKGGASK